MRKTICSQYFLLRVGLALCFLCLGIQGAGGLEHSKESVFKFDIPAQPLTEAINALSSQTETLVLFPYDLVENRESHPVQGRFTVRQALDKMLLNTGLEGGVSKKGVLMISRSEPNSITKGSKMLKNKLSNAIVLAISSLTAAQVAAQDTSTPGLEEIVVTGTTKARTEFNSPLTVTQFDETKLRKLTVNSQADVLRSVPGLKAEGGGGEVATNVFVTGLPSGGQFAFTPLQYDGIPVFSTFGLNSSAFDVYARNDLGIEKLEFVSGGASNLFGAGSVAGIINYISKTGGDEPESTVQFEGAEDGRFRTDFATSGPLSAGSNNYYALSGFYRYDEGPIDTGLTTEGFQLRGNLKHEFSDGSGAFTLYGQVIDDKVQFFLPFPLDADQTRAVGNDGNKVNTVQTEDADRLTYLTPDGVFTTPISDGVQTQGGMIAIDLTKDLGNEWVLNTKAKYAKYSHEFNLFLDGDGITNQPLSLEDFLDVRGFGTEGVDDLPNANFTFSDSGREVPDDFLLFGNRLLDRDRPATDFTFETNLSKSIDFGALSHTFTLGTYISRADAGDENHITTFLAEFNDQPRLVDLNVTDVDGSLTGTAGNELVVSRNGLMRTNGLTGDSDHRALRTALYLTDQIESTKWVLDFGVRIENMEGDIRRANTTSVNMDQSAILGLEDNEVLSSDLSSVSTRSGSAIRGEVDETPVAVSAAGLYRLSDSVNVYANASRGFFFPQLRAVPFNEFGDPAPYEEEEIILTELGVKYSGDRLSGSVSVFYSELNDRENIEFINDGMGNVITVANTTSSETTGAELIAEYRLSESWTLNGNITYQNAEFSEFGGAPENVGNELRRNPEILANTGISYDNGTLDFSLFHSHTGENFANDGNTIELDSFELVNLDAGYTFGRKGGERVRIGVNVFNLFDDNGITEGSPRQASGQTVGEFFIGRPVLPRRVTVRLTYDF